LLKQTGRSLLSALEGEGSPLQVQWRYCLICDNKDLFARDVKLQELALVEKSLRNVDGIGPAVILRSGQPWKT